MSHPHLKQARKLVEDSRSEWENKSRRVIKSLEIEATALGRALGAISWDEAVEGFKKNAVATIEKVMR